MNTITVILQLGTKMEHVPEFTHHYGTLKVSVKKRPYIYGTLRKS